MYNRYVPGSNGIYKRETVHEPLPQPPEKPAPTHTEPQETAPQQDHNCQIRSEGFDLGDLLLLCIIILLLIDSDEEDSFPFLIMAAAMLLQQ